MSASTSTAVTITPLTSTSISSPEREFMLAALRCAKLRVTLMSLELDEIGVALKHNLITAEFAVSWLHHAGLMQFVNVEPFTNKVEVPE
jgi:hypothetical protein